jgi:hypothetical protein
MSKGEYQPEPENTTSMDDSWDNISHIWMATPPSGHLHIFVTPDISEY